MDQRPVSSEGDDCVDLSVDVPMSLSCEMSNGEVETETESIPDDHDQTWAA
jgi:hypothetical protein